MITESRWEELQAILEQIRRFGDSIMRTNARYLRRERILHQKYLDHPNRAIMIDNDKVIRDATAVGRTLSTLATGLNAVIQAELAMHELGRARDSRAALR